LAGIPGIIALLTREITPGERYNFGEATQNFLEKTVSKGLDKVFRDLFNRPAGRKKLVTPVDFLVQHTRISSI
jgi:hypothetical protein